MNRDLGPPGSRRWLVLAAAGMGAGCLVGLVVWQATLSFPRPSASQVAFMIVPLVSLAFLVWGLLGGRQGIAVAGAALLILMAAPGVVPWMMGDPDGARPSPFLGLALAPLIFFFVARTEANLLTKAEAWAWTALLAVGLVTVGFLVLWAALPCPQLEGPIRKCWEPVAMAALAVGLVAGPKAWANSRLASYRESRD